MGISVDGPHTTSIGKFNSILSQETKNQMQDPIVSIEDISRLSKNLIDSRSDSELVAAISTYLQFVQEKSKFSKFVNWFLILFKNCIKSFQD